MFHTVDGEAKALQYISHLSTLFRERPINYKSAVYFMAIGLPETTLLNILLVF
jgi:hypothetical protein